jgi:hypothetical protein
MTLITRGGAWCNGEVAYIAWDVTAKIDGCLGFMVTRVHETGDDADSGESCPHGSRSPIRTTPIGISKTHLSGRYRATSGATSPSESRATPRRSAPSTSRFTTRSFRSAWRKTATRRSKPRRRRPRRTPKACPVMKDPSTLSLRWASHSSRTRCKSPTPTARA